MEKIKNYDRDKILDMIDKVKKSLNSKDIR